jgi:Sec-independent protein translocase protein TatA
MELLGVGPLELILILVIVLLLFSPKDIVGGARKLGGGLNRLYKSDTFRVIQRTSDELRNLPNRLAQETALDDLDKLGKEISQEVREATEIRKSDILPPATNPPPASVPVVPATAAPAAGETTQPASPTELKP